MLCLFTLFSPPPAHAEDTTPENAKRASDHFQRGAEFYAAGDYPKAIVEFLAGYAIVPDAMFMYNTSLCYQRLGNLEEAYSAAQKARDGGGLDPATSDRNLARILSFERAHRARDVARDVAQRPAPEQRDGLGGVGWAGLALLGVGIGLDVAAALTAKSIADGLSDYERAAGDGDRSTYDRLGADLAAKQQTGRILLYAGSGLAAAGLALFLIDLGSGGGEASAFFTPLPDGAMVAWRASFQ